MEKREERLEHVIVTLYAFRTYLTNEAKARSVEYAVASNDLGSPLLDAVNEAIDTLNEVRADNLKTND